MTIKANQFFDVFSLDEIQEIHQVLTKLQNTPNTGEEFYAYTNGFTSADPIFLYIKKKVISKLEKLVNEKINITVGMYLKEKNPWTIHTDYVKNDKHPKGAFLIPLVEENTHTVIFNEECTDHFSLFKKTNKKLQNNAKNIRDTLCSHESDNHLELVSLFAAYRWHLGSVIYWDRKMLHCSDNFLQNGVTEKHALVIFTNQDENL